MSNVHLMRPMRLRSIWISDVHLGFRGCQANSLLSFLKSTQSEYLYLVGDIVDLWRMRRGVYWPQAHNDVVRAILGKAKSGTRVFYVPGNHDELLRDHHGTLYCNCGDWVDSCTALVEHHDGALQILTWNDAGELDQGSERVPAAAAG
jgi:UDP-2,3-diacylglucosamine pyrophosphatase LpxH